MKTSLDALCEESRAFVGGRSIASMEEVVMIRIQEHLGTKFLILYLSPAVFSNLSSARLPQWMSDLTFAATSVFLGPWDPAPFGAWPRCLIIGLFTQNTFSFKLKNIILLQNFNIVNIHT